ncbi:MAG: acetyl-CoA decarbonylase/synthase complex subunit delta [Vicinamibacteria bacterium]|nr:acetyl-CoA decarbonylase/synthase complex subunit delta [Vicinamibacteria bacterium]
MTLRLPSKTWPGTIRTVTLGAGSRRTLCVGGARGLPLHLYEAELPHRPALALEVTDSVPPRWPEAACEPWRDVLGQPAQAAALAVQKFGADLVMLNLIGTHPDRGDRSADEALEATRAVLAAVDAPIIVKGPGVGRKQNDVLARVAEGVSGEALVLHSACQEDFRTLAAVAVAYGHVLVAESPIDMNIAKQLNILLSEARVDPARVLIDPLTGGLGYGLEYTYSVMERIRLAALGGDAMLAAPMICLAGEEAWKAKEAKLAEAQEPRWGRARERGIHWEVTTAMALLLAGADVLVMRHPEALARVRRQIDEWYLAPGRTA